eukprot:3911683-Rhodomonas_salina.1
MTDTDPLFLLLPPPSSLPLPPPSSPPPYSHRTAWHGYAPPKSLGLRRTFATPCPVLKLAMLRVRYAMSGTDVGCAASRRLRFNIGRLDLTRSSPWYSCPLYRPTHSLCHVRIASYARARPCPVLTQRMLLPGGWSYGQLSPSTSSSTAETGPAPEEREGDQ